MTRVTRVLLQAKGKGMTVKRKINGITIPICECKHNFDASGGCIAQVPVELLEEVVDNEGKYAPGNFDKYKAEGVLDKGRCFYCYAFTNTGNVLPRQVTKKTREDFEKYDLKVIRAGKLNEVGHPYYYKTLMDFLNLCEEFGAGLIFTTKMFPFGLEGALETTKYARNNNDIVARIAKDVKISSGEKLAEKLKEINNVSYGVTLLYSLGWNCFEPGAVSQGFTNQWRIEQALKFYRQGVNTSLTIVCDVTGSINLNEKMGSSIKQALNAREKYGINIRLLPIRPRSREMTVGITGDTRKGLLDHTNFFSEVVPSSDRGIVNVGQRYKRKGNQELVPRFFHPDFQKLVDDGIGVCGTVGDDEYCDKCNLDDVRIVFPVKEIPKVFYEKEKEWGKKNQGKLKF